MTVQQCVVVASAIITDGRILVLRRKDAENFLPGTWELPGGHKEPRETCLQALHREVCEETGWRSDALAAVPCHVFDYQHQLEDAQISTVQITYLLRSPTAFATRLSEHDCAAWKEAMELVELEITPDTRSAIASAYHCLSLMP